MIYNIEIDFVNILFILSKQFQDKDVIEFLNTYHIPYIYFNNDNKIQNFLYSNGTILTKFVLGIEHHYDTNKDIFEKSLLYQKSKDKDSDDFSFEKEEYDYEDDDEEEEDEEEKSISDIINNDFKDKII